jgi:L-amino acid N-acyltransferase YncA
MDYKLTPLTDRDREAVIDVFNHFVEHSFAAYPEEKVPYELFDHFLASAGGYPSIGVHTDEGTVVGFGFMRPYHYADTMRRTAEVAYFILPEHTGRGIGTQILEMFIDEAKKRGINNFLASISSLNEQSLNFHRRHGFTECGRFVRVGRKKNRDYDMVWMQKSLE